MSDVTPNPKGATLVQPAALAIAGSPAPVPNIVMLKPQIHQECSHQNSL